MVGGGGIAALETVLALQRLAGARAEIELIAPTAELVHRPGAVAAPFDGTVVPRYDLRAIARDRGFKLRQDTVVRIDTEAHSVLTRTGREVRFDDLVIASGARNVGVVPGALTFRGPAESGHVRSLLDRMLAGAIGHLAFIAPTGATWSLPLYELALQTGALLRCEGVGAKLTLITSERSPLAAFGPEAGAAVTELLAERGVDLRTSATAVSVDGGQVYLSGEAPLAVDAAIALPGLVGPRIPGLPADRLGFLPVDAFCRVDAGSRVYAIGDVAAQAVKQGGLAVQQADVAAVSIAAGLGVAVTPVPYRPLLRGLLLTGGAPLYLRREVGDAGVNAVSDQPLWWPATKVAGGRLSPYLASRPDLLVPKGPHNGQSDQAAA